MKFDIVEFYPNISEQLLNDAINFGKKYIRITDEEIKIIHNAAKTILINKDEIWIKSKKSNNRNPLFDIAMGGKHGAEICELTGLYLLNGLKSIVHSSKYGLYRDDGIVAIDKNISSVEVEQIKKKLHSYVKALGLKITIENPAETVNYLDLKFNCYNLTYCPYRKPNKRISYVNHQSNHPPAILKQIPAMIEYRLSKHSSNESSFNSVKKDYNDALKLSGYSSELKYTKSVAKNKRKRKRKIIWFNPPFCRSVKTKVGKIFFEIIDKHFGKKSKLFKIINRNNVKLSYSCMPNIASKIKNHNNKIMKENSKKLDDSCNCRNQESCPMKGRNCRKANVIYEANIITDVETKTYIGLSSNELKKRIASHYTTINCKPENKNYQKYTQSTELSKEIHRLKSKNINYKVDWKIIASEAKARPGVDTCRLCLKEALLILQANDKCINRRTELMNKCRHMSKFLIKNWRSAIT